MASNLHYFALLCDFSFEKNWKCLFCRMIRRISGANFYQKLTQKICNFCTWNFKNIIIINDKTLIFSITSICASDHSLWVKFPHCLVQKCYFKCETFNLGLERFKFVIIRDWMIVVVWVGVWILQASQMLDPNF